MTSRAPWPALAGLAMSVMLLSACAGAGPALLPTPVAVTQTAAPTTALATAAKTAPAATATPAGANLVPPQASLVPAEADAPAAGICAEAQGEWAAVEIWPDIPSPRCLKVTSQQRLKVANRTDAAVQVQLGPHTLQVPAGAEGSLDVPFGTFLAPGVHRVSADPYSGPEVWLVQAAATPAAAAQRLRIENAGPEDITGLVVLFPGPTADSLALRVEFGDVPAGHTTDYREVPGGVYNYAAYEYTWQGQLVMQPVVDWVGESPRPGKDFTYRLHLDPTQPAGGQIQLDEVVVDAP